MHSRSYWTISAWIVYARDVWEGKSFRAAIIALARAATGDQSAGGDGGGGCDVEGYCRSHVRWYPTLQKQTKHRIKSKKIRGTCLWKRSLESGRSTIFPSNPHPIPHEAPRDSPQTLQRPQKGPRNRSRCRDHLLRRVLCGLEPRRDPKDIRRDEVSAACFPPPQFVSL